MKFIKSLKKWFNVMGFYRSGEFKFFIVDAIRYLIDFSMINLVINSIMNTFKNYNSTRVMDDFFHSKNIKSKRYNT